MGFRVQELGLRVEGLGLDIIKATIRSRVCVPSGHRSCKNSIALLSQQPKYCDVLLQRRKGASASPMPRGIPKLNLGISQN